MKKNKLIMLLFFTLIMCAPIYSQIDLFDDEDGSDNQAVHETFFGIHNMKLITGNEEAGPVGNWMSDALVTMNDAAFKDAPKEYLAARSVIRKSLQVNNYSQQVADSGTNNLPCEDRKKILEKYSLFLGTLYLDMFNMDFFLDENRVFSDEELANIYLALIDVSGLEFYRGYLNNHCSNDLNDKTVLDCGEITKKDMGLQKELDNVLPNMAKIMKNLHPSNVAQEAVNVTNLLSSLPCNN